MKTENHKLLILGASKYYLRTIEQIKKLNYELHVLDKNKNSVGFNLADKYDSIDIVDKKKILNYAINNNINGILPLNDFATRSAFYVAQKLGLVSPSYLTGICGNDKGMMRDVWTHDNLPQPKYITINFNEYSIFRDFIVKKIGFPLVVKPTDVGGAGRGITIASDINELDNSIKYANSFNKLKQRLIIEQYINGIEVTVDCLVHTGTVIPLAISDKIKPVSKFRVATSLNYPAKLSKKLINKIEEITIKATEALGVSNGAIHLELIVNDKENKINLIEMGIRGGGGHVFSDIINIVSGVNAPQELAKIYCGEKPNLVKTKNYGAVYRFFNPNKTGLIKKIEYDNLDLYKKHIVDFDITANVGDKFLGLTNSMQRIGYVVTKGDNRSSAIKFADLIENKIKIDIE